MKYFIILSLSFLSFSTLASDFATSEELRDRYPNITDYSQRAENKKILCPFHRMIERAGLYDNKNTAKVENQVIVSISTIVKAAKEFGCKVLGCSAVTTAVSLGQNTHLRDVFNHQSSIGKVNITRLHKARGVAHECGLTFKKGGSEIDNETRSQTLMRLKNLAIDGRLTQDDLFSVKKKICSEQNVEMTLAGKVEMELIFNYLGGKDRGFIEYEDVERLLHAKMPLTKSIEGI